MDISNMLEVQVNEINEVKDEDANVKENVTPKDLLFNTTTFPALVSQEEIDFYKIMFGSDIASVRYYRLHCTACDAHIGSAPAQAHNMFEHPVLRTLLCANCYEFYGDGTFEQGDDATDMFCRWCANGGNLYCCSYCSNTFCYKCIGRNFTSSVRKRIEEDEKWKCFACNPTDLYSARAICWALLQHVQIVTRILKNEKNMDPDEIEDKMNLDESPCCPRRSKRKRRSIDDERYNPELYIKPKAVRKPKQNIQFRYNTPNGIAKRQSFYSTAPIPIKPYPNSSLASQSSSYAESPRVPSHEQPVIGYKESTMNRKKVMIPPTDTSLLSRCNSNMSQSSLYHMNAGTSNVYVSTSNSPPSHQIFFSYPPLQTNSYHQSQSLPNSLNAMVSIPSHINSHNKSRPLLPKSHELIKALTSPSIIDLDSDSDDDEPKIVEKSNNAVVHEDSNVTDTVDVSSEAAVPVALVSTENGCDNNVREDQPLREMCTTVKRDNVSFNQIMLPHSHELEKFTRDIKDELYGFFTLSDDDKDVQLTAHQKIKQFYQKMRNTVVKLVHINDRVMREYNKWERSQKSETTLFSAEHNTLVSQENIEIPLDMVCINDSDTESESDGLECQVIEPSDFIRNSNILKNLSFYEKDVVNRGVGDYTILCEDKAVQIDNVALIDYEKSIGYSLLTKLDCDSKTKENVLKSVTISDENKFFSKYEEQFIFYLQQNRGIEVKDVKALPDSNETSFEDLIEINSSIIPELLQNIESSVIFNDYLQKCDEEGGSKSHSNLVINDLKTTLASKNMNKNNKEMEQIVSDFDTVTKIQTENAQSDDKMQQEKLSKIYNSISDEKVKPIILSNDYVTSNKSCFATDMEVAVVDNGEGCTIIDD